MSEKESPKGWVKLTVAELKEALGVRGLTVSGRKSELVDRLLAHEKAVKDANEEVDDDEKHVKEEEDEKDVEEEEDKKHVEEEEDEKHVEEEEESEELGVKEENVSSDVKDEPMQQDDETEEEVTITEENVEEEEKEETKVKAEKPKEKDDGETHSKADSLSVNLDQDICNLRDLDESNAEIEIDSKEGDSFVIDRKGGDLNKSNGDEGIMIETVGEVDDEEFGAVVANMDETQTADNENKEDNTAEKGEEKEETKETKEPVKEVYPPVPVHVLPNWMVRKYAVAKRFSCLYIKPLTSKDVLCSAMVEWASRSVYFCINHQRDGKGVAVLNFMTEKEGSEAKEALTKCLGEDVKVVHPSRKMESDFQEELTYKLESPNLAMRTLVIEDAPEATTEDQVCLLFPGAISISKPEVPSLIHKWQNKDYTLPESVNNIFFVEFGYSKAADRAVAEDKDYEIDGQKLRARTMANFQKEYRDYFLKIEEESRKKRKEENERKRKEREKKSLEEVYSDKERLEMCRALKATIQKRAAMLKRMDVPWNERLMMKGKLSSQVLDIVRALDVDTDKRMKGGLKFPETENLMTKHTRQLYQRALREKRMKENKEKKTQQQQQNQKSEEGKDMKLKITVQSDKSREVKSSKTEGTDDVILVSETESVEKMPSKKAVKDSNQKETRSKEVVSSDEKDNKKDQSNDKQKESDKKKAQGQQKNPQKHERTRSVDGPGDGKGPIRKRNLTEKERNEMHLEFKKLVKDRRGWWTICIDKDSFSNKGECEKFAKKYGRVEEVHFTKVKAFIRFGSRSAANAAVKELWCTKYSPEVPPVKQQWKLPAGGDNRGRLTDDRRGGDDRRRSNERGRDYGNRPDRNIPSLLTANTAPIAQQIQQQAQQQILIQQQLQLQQQQQQAALLQQQQQQAAMMQQQHQMQALGGSPGILGANPQMSQAGMRQGASNMMNKSQTGHGSSTVPTLFGASGVPPVKGDNRRDRRGRSRSPERRSRFDQNRHKSPDMPALSNKVSRSPSYNQDSKRSRMNDDYDFGFSSGSQQQRQTKSSSRNDRSSGAGDPSAVANVLKGITQVLSSKMEELSRMGGGTGERAMKEVMESIGGMQGILPTGSSSSVGHSAVASGNTMQSSYTGSSNNQTSSYGSGAMQNTSLGQNRSSSYGSGTGVSNAAYGNTSSSMGYGNAASNSGYNQSSATGYGGTSSTAYSNTASSYGGAQSSAGNMYGSAGNVSAAPVNQAYAGYSQQAQNVPSQVANVGGYSAGSNQYGAGNQYSSGPAQSRGYQQTGQQKYGSQY